MSENEENKDINHALTSDLNKNSTEIPAEIVDENIQHSINCENILTDNN